LAIEVACYGVGVFCGGVSLAGSERDVMEEGSLGDRESCITEVCTYRWVVSGRRLAVCVRGSSLSRWRPSKGCWGSYV
jgi:hypothetical protein